MGCTLVIDTSFGSTVGIVGREPIVETDSRTHVEKLQVNIARAVEEAGLTPADIEEIVVGIGPAPFTGLRAGIVAAKALAATSRCASTMRAASSCTSRSTTAASACRTRTPPNDAGSRWISTTRSISSNG